MLEAAFERLVYPLFRRVEFRGKRRLRPYAPIARQGVRVVGFRGGFRLELNLAEALHRDYLFGSFDLFELRLARRILRNGGDFVDVGAHVGLYTVPTAVAGSRVLAIEPHPESRRRLERNLDLNSTRAIVYPGAVGSQDGMATLRVARQGDAGWATVVDDDRFGTAAAEWPIEMTTVDRLVEKHRLNPALVKIDVEGSELDVITGMEATLAESKAAVIVEVTGPTAAEIADRLRRVGYSPSWVRRQSLVSGIPRGSASINAVFLAAKE
jgi:FkbM family methyltransferase